MADAEEEEEEVVVVLRLKNNSDCPITLQSSPGQVSPFRVIKGKLIRLEVPEIRDGQQIDLKYLMKYPGQEYPVSGHHSLEGVILNGGDSVLFSVPLIDFKKGGELILPFTYEWDPQEGSKIVTDVRGSRVFYPAVEHQLRFVPQLLPAELLR